jgi:hypothetical protein
MNIKEHLDGGYFSWEVGTIGGAWQRSETNVRNINDAISQAHIALGDYFKEVEDICKVVKLYTNGFKGITPRWERDLDIG